VRVKVLEWIENILKPQEHNHHWNKSEEVEAETQTDVIILEESELMVSEIENILEQEELTLLF
jgi:hypothetical protein